MSTNRPNPAESSSDQKRQAAKDVVDTLMDISQLLNAHLNRSQMSLCISLIENGVNPEALATVIKALRQEFGDSADGQGS